MFEEVQQILTNIHGDSASNRREIKILNERVINLQKYLLTDEAVSRTSINEVKKRVEDIEAGFNTLEDEAASIKDSIAEIEFRIKDRIRASVDWITMLLMVIIFLLCLTVSFTGYICCNGTFQAKAERPSGTGSQDSGSDSQVPKTP